MQMVCALANHMFRGRYLLTTPHQQIYTIWDWEMIISVFEYTCLEFQKVGSDFFNTCTGNAGIENRVSTVASRRKVRKNWLLFGVSTSELSSTWMNYVGQQFSLVGDSLEGNEVYHICCSLFPVNSKELHLSSFYSGKVISGKNRLRAPQDACNRLGFITYDDDDRWPLRRRKIVLGPSKRLEEIKAW